MAGSRSGTVPECASMKAGSASCLTVSRGPDNIANMKSPLHASRVVFFTVLSLATNTPAAVLTSCDEASLRAALTGGGVITFGCDGTIVLGRPLVLTADTTLDAGGRQVAISGSNSV